MPRTPGIRRYIFNTLTVVSLLLLLVGCESTASIGINGESSNVPEAIMLKNRLERIHDTTVEVARVGSDRQWKIVSVFSENGEFGDREIALLSSDFAQLESISLYQTQITDKGVRLLARMPSLESILLFHENVSDDGVMMLVDLPKLRDANISSCPNVTWKSLEAIRDHIRSISKK